MKYIIGYGLWLLMLASAIISPDGLGVTFQDQPSWAVHIANVMSNFVSVFAFLMLILGIAMLAASSAVTDINPTEEEKVPTAKIVKDIEQYRLNKFTLSIAAFGWIVMIASGWIVSTICFMFGSLSYHYLRALMFEKLTKKLEKL